MAKFKKRYRNSKRLLSEGSNWRPPGNVNVTKPRSVGIMKPKNVATSRSWATDLNCDEMWDMNPRCGFAKELGAKWRKGNGVNKRNTLPKTRRLCSNMSLAQIWFSCLLAICLCLSNQVLSLESTTLQTAETRGSSATSKLSIGTLSAVDTVATQATTHSTPSTSKVDIVSAPSSVVKVEASPKIQVEKNDLSKLPSDIAHSKPGSSPTTPGTSSRWVPINRPTQVPRVLGILNPKLDPQSELKPYVAFRSSVAPTVSTSPDEFDEADYDPEEIIATTTFESVKISKDSDPTDTSTESNMESTTQSLKITTIVEKEQEQNLESQTVRQPKSLARLIVDDFVSEDPVTAPNSKVNNDFLVQFGKKIPQRHIQRRPVQARLKPANPGPVLRKRKIPAGGKRPQQTSVLANRKIKVRDSIPNHRMIVKVKNTTPKPGVTENDLVTKSTGAGRAIIRLVSTVSPKPFTRTSSTTESSKPKSTTETDPGKRTPQSISRRRISKPRSISTSKKVAESPSRPFKKRTLIRRLPLRGGNGSTKPTTPTLPMITEPPQNLNGTQVSLREKLSNRMRIKDSVLSRVQGKFRSTTFKPVILSSDQDRSKVQSGITQKQTNGTTRTNVKVVKRTRVKGRKEITTDIQPATPSTTLKAEVTKSTTENPRLKYTSTTPFFAPEATTSKKLSPENGSSMATRLVNITTENTISKPIRKGTTEKTTKADKSTNIQTPSSSPKTLTSSLPMKTSTEPTKLLNSPRKTPNRSGALRDDLLAAIRRKISKNKTSTSRLTTPSGPNVKRPNQKTVQASSPASNSVAPTDRPVPFGPINTSQRSQEIKQEDRTKKTRVQFYLRVPGSSRKQNKQKISSHLQGKLARLNAAISEGLANERRKLSLRKERPITEAPIAVESEKEKLERERQLKMRQKLLDRSKTTRTRESVVSPKPTDTSNSTSSRTTVSNTYSKSKTVLSIVKTSNAGTVRLANKEHNISTNAQTVTEPAAIRKSLQGKTTEKISMKKTTAIITTTSKLPPPLTTTIPLLSSTFRIKRTTTPSTSVKQKEIPNLDHPSSHFRPSNSREETTTNSEPVKRFPNISATGLPGSEVVQIVRPVYGDFNPARVNNMSYDTPQNVSDLTDDEREKIILASAAGVMNDISGTTVYVVAVICVIPLAGLVAFVVRLVVRKRECQSHENGSETGLNVPIHDDDMLQISHGRSHSMKQSNNNDALKGGRMLQGESNAAVDFDDEVVSTTGASQMDPAEMNELLLKSVWQFDRQHLRLQTVLGEGNFGKVWKAEADDICGYEGTIFVAVKTAKEDAPQKEVGDLLAEMRIMQQIGPHPNVVTLLGVAVEKEPYLLIMEYVMHGKLLQHLREQRSRQTNFFQFSEADPQGVDSLGSLNAKDLTKYAYGVAKGMEYVVSKGIIHRDLAARNILVDHNKTCKISDFGLSRNLNDTGSEMYEQKTKGALPIRWMAPESLYFSVFTPKSDVWSFGILMWEIVTLGSTPYPGMGAREVMRRVRDGYRLERPSHCHPDLYKIISKCWSGDMNKRPDFAELRKELAKLLEDQHGYIDLQNIPENKYYSMTQNSNEEEKL